MANLDQIAPLYFKDAAVRFQGNPEQKCGAKDWLKAQMPSGKTYKETQDQVKMTQHINLAATMQQLRSFRRMVHALQELLDALDRNQAQVTPQVML